MYIHIICAVFRLKQHSSTSTSGLGYTVNRHKENYSNFNYSIRSEVILHGAQRGAVKSTKRLKAIRKRQKGKG